MFFHIFLHDSKHSALLLASQSLSPSSVTPHWGLGKDSPFEKCHWLPYPELMPKVLKRGLDKPQELITHISGQKLEKIGLRCKKSISNFFCCLYFSSDSSLPYYSALLLSSNPNYFSLVPSILIPL